MAWRVRGGRGRGKNLKLIDEISSGTVADEEGAKVEDNYEQGRSGESAVNS